MPGIVGYISASNHPAPVGSIDAMVSSILHDPSYRGGSYSSNHLGISVGWACHPGSFGDCVPIWNEKKDICLIWTGENFADSADIQHLRGRGHSFAARGANYLVHLYEEHGPKFLNRLNGWFSGVLLDLRESTIVVFNDRYGLGRLYYHDGPEGFFFASEAKALLKVLPQLRQLDFTSLGEFFSCGCPLQNRTLFHGIRLMPSGSAWVFSPGRKRREECYFRPQVWSQQPALPVNDYYEQLKEIFPRILARYFTADAPVAVSLTGGVDSRMMMAWARCPPGSLPTYTFGGMFGDCRDIHLARQVTTICKQPHRVIRVGEEFISQFSRLAERTVYVSDGMMDVSGAADLYANQVAKHFAPIRMTGNYGGEILRSIVAFKPVSLKAELFEPQFLKQVSIAERTYREERTENPLEFIAFKQVPWHHYSRMSVEQSELTIRSPYLDNDLVSLAFQVPPEHARKNDLSLRLIAEGNPRLGEIGTDRGIYQKAAPGFSRIRNIFEELTFKAEYAYDYGMPHWLAKLDRTFKALHLERLFLGRHKFYHFRLWYRDQLSGYVRDILLDPRSRSRPHLNGAELEQVVNSHINGTRNYTREIHKLLACELLHRQLLES